MTGQDATQGLAERHSRPRRAVEPPDGCVPCDRCRRPLGRRIYRIAHGQLGGELATWHVCHLCDADLEEWIRTGADPVQRGGT